VAVERRFDVAVVGGGPAGLAAARTAAEAGARVVVLERAAHPRYKTCGGGLLGTSLARLRARVEVPVRQHVSEVRFTHDGRRGFSRRVAGTPLLALVQREEMDLALARAARAAGAEIREDCLVRGLAEESGGAHVRLADGERVAAATVVGADGSGGVTGRYVGVTCSQVDLGLEVELPTTSVLRRRWEGRLLIDWGPVPGSYGWVFPKGDLLTVGVIAARGGGPATRAYLRDLLARLGLAAIEPRHDSGHLTRCRDADSPLRRGRVVVAGDAAGLLDPWTREGISHALRSGELAGAAAARAAATGPVDGHLDGYARAVEATLGREMAAGRALLAAFERHPGAFHGALATPPGWRIFTRYCRGEADLAEATASRPVSALVGLLARG
jgi:geranylgeranyl reductase family protein